MSYNRDTLWRLYDIGGADLALRYAELASEPASTERHSPDLELCNFRFYEGAETHSGPSTPDFNVRFPRSTTRFVMYWAEFRHPWKYSSFQYNLQLRYFRPDGSMMSEIEDRIEAMPQRPSFWHSGGKGWDEPGKWQPGEYRVELLIDGIEKQSGTFTVFEDKPQINFDAIRPGLFLPAWLKNDDKATKQQPKGLGFDGWLKKLGQECSAAAEQPRFDPRRPLDDLGKMKALVAIDQRFTLATFDTRPGRVRPETLGVIEAIAQDYQALMSLGPPKPPFAFWTEQSVRQKIGDTFDLAARVAGTLHDQAAATRYYKAAREAYHAAGDKVKAERCQTELSRLRAVETGDVDAEVRRLRSELAKAPKKSLAAARAAIDLGMLYSNNGDDTEALELLRQAESDLKAVSSDPTGIDLANALSSSVADLLQGKGTGGPSVIENKMEANNLYRLLYTAYARIYDTTDPAKAAEYRAKVVDRDSRQTNDEFSKAMLRALHGGLLGKL
jgi:tetratricopeptide (TPR) repeat protein